MTPIVVKAETLLKSNLMFDQHSSELRALGIISKLDLTIKKDQNSILVRLADIAKGINPLRKVVIRQESTSKVAYPVQISLNGKNILSDEEVRIAYNEYLQNRTTIWKEAD